jgi:hypothetical protein
VPDQGDRARRRAAVRRISRLGRPPADGTARPAEGYLGDFGSAQPALDLKFGYLGHVIRVAPDFSELALADFITEAATVDEDSPAAMGVIHKFAALMVHPEDFDQFWSAALAGRQSTADLLAVISSVMGAVVGRPTQPLSDSSAGQRRTGPKSTPGLSPEVLHRLDGRPDLQLAVVRAYEAQAAG